MTLTAPYGQNNYMGEYTSDANCLTFIRNNKWDSSKDGTGNPEDGMWYYNTNDHLIHEYHNGNWLTQWNPYGNDIASTNGAFNMVVDGTTLMEFGTTMTRMIAYLDMDAQRLIMDADGDTWIQADNDDEIDFYRLSAQRYRLGLAWRMYQQARWYQYNSTNNEFAYSERTDTEWLFYTTGAQITLSGTQVALKYNGSTRMTARLNDVTMYTDLIFAGASDYIENPYAYGNTVSGYPVYVNSDGRFARQSSSIRFKDLIGNIEDVSWIHKLKPVKYTYKDDPDKQLWLGFIAEDVEEVYPELVDYVDGEVFGTNFQKLIAPILKEVQNLRKELDTVKTELEELKCRNV